uniref:Uncharacterized protein n=1 Tax=Timema bartmani TaxID=61472 RepID=A0A7R9I7X7_9NEOP|nr:unnamed protein product [Timema bartmani]
MECPSWGVCHWTPVWGHAVRRDRAAWPSYQIPPLRQYSGPWRPDSPPLVVASSPNGDRSLNRTGKCPRAGLPSLSNRRTQDSRESLLDVPVAHIARMVPSSCSCTVGGA